MHCNSPEKAQLALAQQYCQPLIFALQSSAIRSEHATMEGYHESKLNT